MSEKSLVLPRRLAIQILHAAQVAQPDPIRGIVASRDGEPASFHLEPQPLESGERHWAKLWSHPQAAAVPSADELADGGLSLLVSLNTKGVLEMRAWRLDGGIPREQTLKIRD